MGIVGVITRTKDRPIMLPRAMESILRQDLAVLTWTIVNDGGDPVPVESVAEEARRKGIDVRVIHHSASLGMEAASNAGIRATPCEYLAIHDDDDTWETGFVSTMLSELATRPQHAGIVCHCDRIDEVVSDEAIRITGRRPFNHWLRAIYLSEMAEENPFPPISFLFRKSAWEALGGFDESLPVLGDWDFNLRILRNADILLLPRSLANYHHRPAAQGNAYGNSIGAGIDKHVFWDAHIRNKHLREDLASGRFGLGALLADGRARVRWDRRFAFAGRVSSAAGRMASSVARLIRR